MNEVRLEIVAKAAASGDEKQLSTMLRPLCAERMGLRAHTEQRESPVYALTLDKGGPKFHESTSECPVSASRKNTVTILDRISMREFASMMSQDFGRPFVDATGLKGRYDLRLDITLYLLQPSAD